MKLKKHINVYCPHCLKKLNSKFIFSVAGRLAGSMKTKVLTSEQAREMVRIREKKRARERVKNREEVSDE